ncbi:unnamed protein product [Microthlaspi erraticum]|uniref:Uncharacterized protein n=1 Tax=Microthlaspi erraticum TaxID=1685480 RepID=A0A6D2KD41_9BRAS|nr:unnamed protein product [Microthlaspi erraticum]
MPFLPRKFSAVLMENEITTETAIEGLETDGMGTCAATVVLLIQNTINVESEVMLFVAKMLYRVVINYHIWFYIFCIFRYSFKFFPVPYILSGSTFGMHDIATAPLTRIAPTSPVHLAATNSAYRIDKTKKRSARNAMLMPVDVYDAWKAKTGSMDHETTLKTCLRAAISLKPASITCKRIESWKKGELVIMSFQIHKRLWWWGQNTAQIQGEVTRRTMIKPFINRPSTKTTFYIGIVWWKACKELERVQRMVRVVYLFRA